MRKGETRVFITLGVLGVLFLMPLSGDGADLTISNVITGNGNMTLNGAMSATSFSGNASGLTNLDPTKLSSGTANINISGNAATVTNGVYSSGSYTDPSWITSLSPGKLTSGTANINISGNAATATTATTANSVAANAVTPATIAFYGNVAVVALSGGDYSSPATAMGAYLSWCGTPSETNPCLLKIMPGVYDIGTNTLQMQPYVDVEGSGENVTIITGSIEGYIWGVVQGADNAECRFLTVRNTGGGTYAVAFYNLGLSSSAKMTHVTVSASGGSYNRGVYNSSSSPTMTNVKASASGGTSNFGVDNYNFSSPKMTHVTAFASGGSNSYGVTNVVSSSPVMTNVTASASEASSSNNGIFNSSSSPTMTNVKASASGGSSSYGVYNAGSSSPTMTNVTASASEASSNNGIANTSGSSPKMTNVTASASGTGSSNYGFFNVASSPATSPTMTNVTASASGGLYNFGILNAAYDGGSGLLKLNHSVIQGSTNTVSNNNGWTTYIGNTQLDGGAVSGTLTCVGAYDENYVALNANCQ